MMRRLLAACLIFLQTTMPVFYVTDAWAQQGAAINPDRSVPGQRPVVNVSANGVPVVQIAPPSAAGVSNNRFTDYNVGPQGVILNNSGANSQTQLGGWIGGNPMLGNSSARTILNQVTGSAPSQLGGFTEVAGNRANVVVANPNGITCNGCGFINAPRVTLTTGNPQFGADGSISGFDVQRGQIGIEGQGLHARGADQLDLISRSLRVNAEVWANRLEVVAGRAQVDYASSQVSAAPVGDASPAVSIDVAALGGMYANSIRMIGTEAGVGVNSAGTIAALTGELQVSSAGDVRIVAGQVQAKSDIAVRSDQEISNAGVVRAEGNVVLDAAGALQNSGVVTAAGNTRGQAARVVNTGIVAAGVDAQGQVALAADVSLTASESLRSSGQILAGRDANLSASAITLDGGKLNANKQASVAAIDSISNRGGEMIGHSTVVNAGAGLDNAGGMLAAESLTISSKSIDNSGGTIVQTGQAEQFALHAQNGIVNKDGRIAANAENLSISGSRFENRRGKVEHAGTGKLDIQTPGALDNAQGSIASNGAVSVGSGSTDNTDGLIRSQGALAITGDGGINNHRGELSAAGAATLATQGSFDNTSGSVQANGPLAVQAGTALVNNDGVMQAGQLDLRAGRLANVGGELLQTGTGPSTVDVTTAFDNTGGRFSSNGGTLDIRTGSLDNTSGYLSHADSGAMKLHSTGALTNAGGQILANETLSISAQELSNTAQAGQSGLIQAGADAAFTIGGKVSNAGGSVAAGGAIMVQAQGEFDNAGGVIEAAKALSLSAANIDNAGGSLVSLDNGGMSLNAGGAIDNAQGFIGANGAIAAHAASLSNQQGVVTGAGNISVSAARLDNDSGVIQSQQAVVLNASGASSNRNGLVQAEQLKIASGSLDNTGGHLLQTGVRKTEINIIGAIDNTDGVIASAGNDVGIAAQNLDNTRGSIQHAGTGTLAVNAAQSLTNIAGTVSSNADVKLNADTIVNGAALVAGNRVQGRIEAGGNLQVNAASTLRNDGGVVQSIGALQVNGNTLSNAQGAILSNQSASLELVQLDNDDGEISADRLSIDATEVRNVGGAIIQLGGVGGSLNASQGISNAGGTIASNGGFAISADSLDNRGGAIQTAANSNLNVVVANGIDNSAAGRIASVGNMQLQSGSLDNRSGKLTSGGAMDAAVAGTLDNAQGTIASIGNTSVVTGGDLRNVQGVIGSVQGGLQVASTGATDNSEGRLEAALDVALVAKGADNGQGTIAGNSVTLNTQGQALSNAGGVIAARNALDIRSGRLDNDGGLLQAIGAMRIDTSGKTLANTQSGTSAGILGQDSITLKTGDLVNQGGFIGGKGAIAATSAGIDNSQGGAIVGQDKLAISGTGFDNRGGGVQAQGNIALDLGAGELNNRGSLLRSGGTLSIDAGNIVNSDTLGVGQGLEGLDVRLSAGAIDNTSGAIRANEQLAINTAGTFTNVQGLASSLDSADINAAGIVNTQGTLIADQNLRIVAGSLSGDGKLLSRGDMSVALNSGFDNAGQVQANNNLSFTSQGTLNNSGLIRAGNTLDLHAQNLTNHAAGEISAGVTNITVQGSLDNRGLIDGTQTRVSAASLSNTGRIYGDHVALQAGTLVNDTTGVIAARGRMDLGVGSLTNREDAIIYSAGDLHVGGSLTAQGQASGYANSVLNASATIESAGSMRLAANSLVNRNDHFSMTTRSLGSEQIYEYQPSEWTTRLSPSSVGFNDFDRGRLVLDSASYPISVYGAAVRPSALTCGYDDWICGPNPNYSLSDPVWALFGIMSPPPAPELPWGCNVFDGTGCESYNLAMNEWRQESNARYTALDQAIFAFNNNLMARLVEDWYTYSYTRTTSESVVNTSDPARILAGGDMVLAGSVMNDKSQIIAGGAIDGSAASVANVGAQGTRTVSESGTVHFTELVSCGLFGGSHCRNNYAPSAYSPAPQVTTTTLPVGYTQEYTAVGSGRVVPNATVSTVAIAAAAARPVVAAIGDGQNVGSVAAVVALDAANGKTASHSALVVAGAALPDIAGAVQTVALPAVAGSETSSQPIVIRSVVPILAVSSNALFKTHTEPGSLYLIETDPRFVNYRDWISSDYMLQQLDRDPAKTLKRLGDGFYEQKLVAEQIMLATGQRFVGDYTNNEEQYQALMTAGAEFGKAYNLTVGVALTEEQMQLLTRDIVWLVEREVTLADGSRQTVLVPQAYVRVREGDLQGDGTLIAGRTVRLDVAGDLNNSGIIAGRDLTQLTADNVNNLMGGRIHGNHVALSARQDLNNLSADISGNTIELAAGRDIQIRTNTIDTVGQTGTRTGADRTASVKGNHIAITAGRDLTVAGANVQADGNLLAVANRHIAIDAVQTTNRLDLAPSGHIREHSVQHVGSQVGAGGNLTLAAGLAQEGDLTVRGSALQAGQDLFATGSKVNVQSAIDSRDVDLFTRLKNGTINIDEHTEGASGGQIVAGRAITVVASGTNGDLTLQGAQLVSEQGAITLAAGRDLKLHEQTLTQSRHTETTYRGGTLVSRTSRDTVDDVRSTHSIGSTVSGDSVQIGAGRDLTARGATIVATQDLTLAAANNLTLAASQDSETTSGTFHESTSGLFGSGGSITLGKKQHDKDYDGSSSTHTGTTVASLEGNVTLSAGKATTLTASDVLAPKGDIAIQAQTVEINAATDSYADARREKFSQSGLTLSVSSPVITAGQTVGQMADAAGKTSDPRMKALAAATGALTVKNAVDDLAKADPSNPAGISVSLTLGSSKSESQQHNSGTQAVGSTVAAGNNVNIVAAGTGKNSDITVTGSKISAGGDATLDAEGAILLQAARSTAEQHSKNDSSSAGIGVSASLGAKTGIGITASASAARGHADGSDLIHSNSRVEAGHTVTIRSGSDTTLKGAVVAGKQVVADIGGDLKIESLQDTSVYDGKQQSAGGSLTVGISNMPVSGSISASRSKIDGSYASVVEQSGIKAGDGGYRVTVQGDTDLKGGVIASSDHAIQNNRNRFDGKGSLTQSDIVNTASYHADSIGGSFSTGTGPSASAGTSLGVGSASGSQASVTKSGIGVSTASDTTGAIAPIFEANKVQADVDAQMRITQAFSREAPKAVANYAGGKAEELKQQAEKETDPQKRQALEAEQKKWEEGGEYRVALHTVAGAFGGGVQGAAGALVSASVADDLNQLQADMQESLEASGMSPGAAKAAAQAATGLIATGVGAAVGGGQGAVMALGVDANNRQLHPTETQWIKDNAKRFAQQQGISEQEAERRLAQQAFREVQFGAAGETDGTAQAFLKNETRGMLLPGDPSIAGQTVGYMFRADPVQKAATGMYAAQVVSDPGTLAFYAKNGITQPTMQQVQDAAAKDASTRTILTSATLGAAGAAIAVTVPPALSWCLSNPVACNRIAVAGGEIAAGDALGPTSLAVLGTASAVKAVRSADEVNAAMRAKGWEAAWSPGTPVIETTLQPGTKVNMIVDAKTADAIKKGDPIVPGGWATFDDVNSVAVDMRQQAAITSQFKKPTDGPFYVVEMEITQPVTSNIGFVGKQTDTTGGLLRGGGTQVQFDEAIKGVDRNTFIKAISLPKPLQ